MTPELITANYIIRQFEKKDLKTFADYRAMPAIAQYQSWTNYSNDDAVALFENTDYAAFDVVGKWYQLAITDKNSDQLIGDIAVHFTDEQQVEIGFTIAPQFQQKGVAFEAVNGLLQYLFTTLKKHRVIAITDTRNLPSCRLLEKLGFRKEAHYVQNIYFKGSWGDEYLYAILASEPNK